MRQASIIDRVCWVDFLARLGLTISVGKDGQSRHVSKLRQVRLDISKVSFCSERLTRSFFVRLARPAMYLSNPLVGFPCNLTQQPSTHLVVKRLTRSQQINCIAQLPGLELWPALPATEEDKSNIFKAAVGFFTKNRDGRRGLRLIWSRHLPALVAQMIEQIEDERWCARSMTR